MTFTHKLARRLARLRTCSTFLLPILAACAAGEPTTPSTSNNSGDGAIDGPVAVSPRQVTLEGTQGVLFRAFESLIPGSSQVTSIEWTTTGGSIAASGNYTPTATGGFRVVGRRKGNPHNPPDTSIVVVVPPQPTLAAVEVTPSTVTLGGGLQQQFTAVGRTTDGYEVPIGVTWTATGGSIDAGGLYTASMTPGTYKVAAKHVTTGLTDTAVVTVPPATLVSISLTPATVSLGAGQTQQFTVTGKLSDGTTSNVPAAFSATGGSISVTGYYTAGSTGGTYRVIATAQGGKADTSSVTISGTVTQPPPTIGGLWRDENFGSYTSIDQYRTNPYGWQASSPPSWFHQSQLALDATQGYSGSKQSLRYDWPGGNTCDSDYMIGTSYKMPAVSELWVEAVHKFATNFNVNTTNTGGACSFGEYKLLLLWRTIGDRFDLVNGHGGYSWWSANPQTPLAGYPPLCSGAGSGGNCEVTALGTGVAAMLWDGLWHVYRWHIKFNSAQGVKDGIVQLWVDGKLVKDVENIDMTNYTTGEWSNRLVEIFLGGNSNSGTSAPTHTWWGRLRIWTSNPGW